MSQENFFSVSGGHKLYYEVQGDPDGIPVLFLHGGPGFGYSDYDKKLFDQDKFRVLFFDQRGASKSEPFGSMEHNTTDHLVDDINVLTAHCGFDKFIIFGGSWGSALALIYSIRNPERVIKLLLRGIFLANQSAIHHFIDGSLKPYFPEAWKRFSALVPEDKNIRIADYYYDQMCSEEKNTANKYAYEWSRYEMSIYKMGISQEQISEILDTIPYVSLARLEAHYITHDCFLPENYILDHASDIAHIPTVIVNGRYDFICPPLFAYQLHQKLKHSTLHILEAGHAASEPAIERQLKLELEHLNPKSWK